MLNLSDLGQRSMNDFDILKASCTHLVDCWLVGCVEA